MAVIYRINGKTLTPEQFRQGSRGRAAGAPAVRCVKWPVHSDSEGVHPSQRQAAQDYLDRRGVPTQFDELGRAVFRSRDHYRRYCAAGGLQEPGE